MSLALDHQVAAELPTAALRIVVADDHAVVRRGVSQILSGEFSPLEVREAARKCDDDGDSGSNDLLTSDVLRTNEMQVWFLAEHLVTLPVVSST